MVDYTELRDARPHEWSVRGDEWISVTAHCTQCAADLIVGVRNLNSHWPDEAGALNTRELSGLADAYGTAGLTCKNVASTLHALADAASRAQSDLQWALANAQANGLTVTDNGEVTGPRDKSWQISETSARINNAVAAATRADQDAAGTLNSFTSQVGSTSPAPGDPPGAHYPDAQIQAGAVNATGTQLVNLANDAQTANSKLLANSEIGMQMVPSYYDASGNDKWASTVALGFCAYRWHQHLDGLVSRLSAVGSGVTASAKNYDAADQEAASLLNSVFTDMKK
ncbi:MAG TPA: hypothetical protein VG247_24350 [Pseudonocardiaceae bacterium]|jgi:hypothetical protein|nr:hypothetical protein [Pseudonocardiaceae bacterium]